MRHFDDLIALWWVPWSSVEYAAFEWSGRPTVACSVYLGLVSVKTLANCAQCSRKNTSQVSHIALWGRTLGTAHRLYSKHGLGWGRVTYTHEGTSWLGVAMAIDMCSYHQVSKHAKQIMYHMIFHVVMLTTHKILWGIISKLDRSAKRKFSPNDFSTCKSCSRPVTGSALFGLTETAQVYWQSFHLL